jgi:hypothetical protein
MSWLYGIVVLLVVGYVLWRLYVASYRGAALWVSLAAMSIVVGTGIARGAGASGWWMLLGITVGGGLSLAAERLSGGRAGSQPSGRRQP